MRVSLHKANQVRSSWSLNSNRNLCSMVFFTLLVFWSLFCAFSQARTVIESRSNTRWGLYPTVNISWSSFAFYQHWDRQLTSIWSERNRRIISYCETRIVRGLLLLPKMHKMKDEKRNTSKAELSFWTLLYLTLIVQGS